VKMHEIILRPLVTEKSTLAREQRRVVSFAVNPRANKHQVKQAVESLFQVQVEAVRTMRMPRKSRRLGRFTGRKPEWKKALVTLHEGQSVEFFEGV